MPHRERGPALHLPANQRSLRRLQLLGLGATSLFLAGCFDFDGAWGTYCKTSDCTSPARDAGLVATPDGGPTDAGDSSDAGGASDAGGSGDAGDASDAGGTTDAGGAADGGGARCLGFGTTCSVEGECCATSDAGLPMACSRNNWCQDTARDCRNDGFTCSRDEQCCNGVCGEGRCAVSARTGEACESGRQCHPDLWLSGDSCAFDGGSVGVCTDDGEVGSGCSSAAFCASGLSCSERHDGGPFSATCQRPADCSPLRASATADAGCCDGLVPVDGGSATACRLDNGAWCKNDSDCASGSCYGYRCRTGYPSRGDRCDGFCTGATNYCDPVNGLCMNRWCLPAGLNAFSGCCAITSIYICAFADGGMCNLPGFQTSNAQQCCSGRISTGGSVPTCDSVRLF